MSLLRLLWRQLKKIKLLPDLNRIQTWAHIAISVMLFSIFQIKGNKDKADQAATVKVVEQKIEQKIDSITSVQHANVARIIQMQRQTRQMLELVVTQDDKIKKINRQLLILQSSEKNALRKIDKMTDPELQQYFKTLKEVEK